MLAYYNEIDPYCVQWLNNLMDAGLITNGFVDNRSIQDIPHDAPTGYTRQHYFAGIAGWDLAMQIAGWPDDLPLVTASCPCQPFSATGKHAGTKDTRHLWPDFYMLVAIHRPQLLCGEQVGSKAGRAWMARVYADLGDLGYRVGVLNLPAAGVGAPQVRQRLYFCAAHGDRFRGEWHRKKPLQRESVLSRFQNVRSIEDLYGRPAIPEPLVRRYSDGIPPGVADGGPLSNPNGARILHGIGNAIVPDLAAAFLQSFMDCIGVEPC